MGKFIRISLLTLFILAVSAAPLFAAAGGNGKGDGNAWGKGGNPNHGVPEIDPSLAPSALALLSGGLLILKSKSGKKDK